jgi:hypothetical protein
MTVTKGYALADVVKELARRDPQWSFPDAAMGHLLEKMADVE